MISTVRNYINSVIAGLNTDLQEWTDVFNAENIPNTLYEKRYFLNYQVSGIEKEQTTLDYTVNATVQIFKTADRRPKDEYDEIMNLGVSIGNAISNTDNLYSYREPLNEDNPIYNVALTSINSDFPTSNDNKIIVTLELSFNLKFPTC